jgi:UDP-N-acetylmuramoylalanine--D-glutamate ligase
VVLNITPDHLDRHGSLAEYEGAKARIVSNQTADDVAVLNFDDARVRAFAGETAARIYPYRCAGHSPDGAWLDAGAVALSLPDGSTLRISLDGMRLIGAHNVENALAALATVAAAGVDPLLAATALATFSGLPHRCEVVARRAGVTWIDDSKATNTGAAVRALTSFGEPVVWIGGGRDKGLDFSELAQVAGERVRAAVLIGEAAEKIADALHDDVPVHHAASIEAAVRTAAELAETGDVVLLAPACASHDQFADYAERGDRFRRAVNQLNAEAART